MNDVSPLSTLDLLASRRSVPPILLKPPAPTPVQLHQLLTLATRVPDHGKLAPWRFIVFEGVAREKAGAIIAAVFAQDNPDAPADRMALEARRLAHAPMVVAVLSRAAPHVKIPEWEQVLSAGAVAMALTVALKAMGFSSAWLTEWFGYDRRVLRQLGVADDEKLAGFIHIGHCDTIPPDRVRPVVADLVTYF